MTAEAAFAALPPGSTLPKGPEPNGIDWRMPPRLNAEVKTWTASEGLPTRDQVHPKQWHAELFLTRNGNAVDACPSGKWAWTVEAPKGARVIRKPGPGCRASMDVSQLGKYKVTASNRKQSTTVHATVDVKDWLIVGLGDSNGSGEGNPPFEFERCNRSEASNQYLDARYVESHDPRSSVTFLFASCSGAIIQDLYKTRYEGINPSAGVTLQPQIKQVAYLAERHSNDPEGPDRQVDSAIVSIGVNNLGFGPLLAYCVLNFSPSDACEHRSVIPTFNAGGGVDAFTSSVAAGSASLQNWIQTLTTRLPATYDPLAHALAASNLNSAVAQAARSNGWRAVALPQSVFTGPPVGHGYCSSVPYFVTLNSALAAGNKPGVFHPNGTGHVVTSQASIPQLCEVLYRNRRCDGTP